jgi:hypothetical protein
METITYILKSVTLEKYRDTINESIVVSFILGVYNFLPYYSNFLDERTKLVLSVLGILYLLY